ncbi:MAG: CDP-diacylglycerol--glycerol-3-phosphate 3-phosphatidyltransferase [Oscillospiraceae bacterium]|nr:CDP-diacylglycerol--glycerol-3-phosphate 3-phosphatidyltransferase [Oscillospiraceae bacterium]
MTVASSITLARIALIPVFMWAMVDPFPYAGLLALIIFMVASFTDAVDGYIARRMNQVTNFGKFMDPLADKLLVTSALLMFVQRGEMSAWAAMIIVAREFLVTSLRMVAVAEGRVIAAGWAGKVKTVVQILCIAFLLTGEGRVEIWPEGVTLGAVAVWLMAATTIWSGAVYIVRHRDVLKSAR